MLIGRRIASLRCCPPAFRGCHAAHWPCYWLLMSGALASNRQRSLLWAQSVISNESKEMAGKHELD